MRSCGSRKQKFIIDGFPRNELDFLKWNKAMGQKSITPFIVYFTCSQKTKIKRFSMSLASGNLAQSTLE